MRAGTERLKVLFAEYGVLALVLWYTVFGVTIVSAAALLEFGVSWPWLEEQAGSAGTWLGAYVIAKAAMPARVAIVAALVPAAARLRSRVFGDPSPS